MKKNFIILIFLLLPFILISCGEEPPEDDSFQVASKVNRKASKKTEEVAPPQELIIPANEDRRNPFKSHLAKVPPPKKDNRVKGPLECCPLSAFNVNAVMSGLKESKATVVAPGKKRYIVKVGMYIGDSDGKIAEITQRGILVKEPVYDDKGTLLYSNDVEISLPSKE